MKYNKIILTVLIILSLLTSCKSKDVLSKHSDSFIGTFDTVITVVAYTDKEEDYIENYNYIRDRFQYFNNLFDIYNSYDNIVNLKNINNMAGKKPVKVSQDIIDVLLFSKQVYKDTKGEVNIAFGSVLSVWQDIKNAVEEGSEINWNYYDNELKLAAEHVDIDDIIIDDRENTVFLADEDMSIDLGSIGKGYAEQKIIEDLRRKGIENLLINAGGSILVTGKKMGDAWIVGVQNPDLQANNQIYMKISLNDEAMVSSGNYQRFFTIGEKRYHHIIDKDTLYPSDNFASVTLVSDNSAVGDALSTALFNMDVVEGKALVNSMEGYEALWIYDDGYMENTIGFERYIDE